MWCFAMCIHCEMNTSVMLINICPLTSCCVCVCSEHLRFTVQDFEQIKVLLTIVTILYRTPPLNSSCTAETLYSLSFWFIVFNVSFHALDFLLLQFLLFMCVISYALSHFWVFPFWFRPVTIFLMTFNSFCNRIPFWFAFWGHRSGMLSLSGQMLFCSIFFLLEVFSNFLEGSVVQGILASYNISNHELTPIGHLSSFSLTCFLSQSTTSKLSLQRYEAIKMM